MDLWLFDVFVALNVFISFIFNGISVLYRANYLILETSFGL